MNGGEPARPPPFSWLAAKLSMDAMKRGSRFVLELTGK
jgi:hypothetical protein